MRITPDAWLASVLERPVFRVDEIDADLTPFHAHTTASAGAFYYAKVAAQDVAGLARFAAAGFRVVEGSMTFARPVSPPLSRVLAPLVDVRNVDAQSAAAVLDVAECAFRYSRFHLDCAFDARTANRVKREWIRSYVEGRRGDRLLVAFAGDEPLAFLALMFARRGDAEVAIIDLIGVRPDHQGRGIGAALIGAALEACASRTEMMEVGTQTANVPSMRLYERLGFRIARTGFTLHLHIPHANRSR